MILMDTRQVWNDTARDSIEDGQCSGDRLGYPYKPQLAPTSSIAPLRGQDFHLGPAESI